MHLTHVEYRATRPIGCHVALRRPARLVVDGLIVLLMSGIMYVAWVMFVEYTRPVSSIEPSRHQRNLGVMFSSAFYSLWYLGVVTVVVGCVRILADAIAGTRSSAK